MYSFLHRLRLPASYVLFASGYTSSWDPIFDLSPLERICTWCLPHVPLSRMWIGNGFTSRFLPYWTRQLLVFYHLFTRPTPTDEESLFVELLLRYANIWLWYAPSWGLSVRRVRCEDGCCPCWKKRWERSIYWSHNISTWDGERWGGGGVRWGRGWSVTWMRLRCCLQGYWVNATFDRDVICYFMYIPLPPGQKCQYDKINSLKT